MVPEKDPFAGFTMQDVYDGIYAILRGEPAPKPDVPLLPQAPRQTETQIEEYSKYQAWYLGNYFDNRTISRNIELEAKKFKQDFETDKREKLKSPSRNRSFWEQMTLQSLTAEAKRQFDAFVRLAGQTLDPSVADIRRKDADSWGIIQQIVQAAAELK